MQAVDSGLDCFATLELAAECEDDPWDGPCCGIGPIGIQSLLQQLGMDFGLVTLGELKSTKALPKPFTLVKTLIHQLYTTSMLFIQ